LVGLDAAVVAIPGWKIHREGPDQKPRLERMKNNDDGIPTLGLISHTA